jgi:NADPH:quinone reductase-like Zn-dependent oxidoreductase
MSINGRKKLAFAEFGPPPVLRIEEVTIPEQGEAEALVRVKAPSIKRSDIADIAGHFRNTNPPQTTGRICFRLGATCKKK